MDLQNRLISELKDRSLFDGAHELGIEYIKNIDSKPVFPSKESLELLKNFDHDLSPEGLSAQKILKKFQNNGSPNTIAQIGGRYFGFVNGSAIPASLVIKSLSVIWDQCGGLYATSPINAKLESVCEKWLIDIFGLPKSTKAGFVSGTSMANLAALTAARYHILKNLNWDVNEKGLKGSPNFRIIAHEQTHASIKKTLAILGLGIGNVEWIDADKEGRLNVKSLPKLDNSCIVILQAGNVNSGNFDDFETICNIANKCNAWVHIDGAFGLWARTSSSLSHLTKGMENADSWAVDGHKTLNTPYDNGIVMCRHENSFVTSLQATGEYLVFSDQRDPILYGPEMSKRSRAFEIWAAMLSLGKNGIDELVTGLHEIAKIFEEGLSSIGFEICNEVVFNQVLVHYKDDDSTEKILRYLQNSGRTWMGGSKWHGRSVIRISVCSWMTTKKDVDEVVELFQNGMDSIH